jgi:oligopeptide transport system substrate-binding protein
MHRRTLSATLAKTLNATKLAAPPALAALLALASCTRGPETLDVTLAGGKRVKLPVSETLRLSLTSEPQTLDWNLGADASASGIIDNMMDGLTQFDVTTGRAVAGSNAPAAAIGSATSATSTTPAAPQLKPALATKWESTDQARKWKFTLRQNVTWSDGHAFEPQQVLDGWERLLKKETGAQYAYFLFGIKNAREFNQGKVTFDKVGIKITGPNEITVELEKPMAYFPMLLTHSSTYPIRVDLIKKFGIHWTDAENSVSLGPFLIKAWQHDKMIILTKNPSYYGDQPHITNIVLYMIQEKATEINLFDSGKLDAVHALPSVQIKTLKQRPEFKTHGLLTTYFYGMNLTKPPMDSRLVRKAIAHAIDKNEIVQMLGAGQKPLNSWVPEGMFGYDADVGLKFDPLKAKRELDEAGYPDPAKLPRIEIKFNTGEDHERIGENIQAQLKRNLGINVELKTEEWKVLLNTLQVDPPQIFRFGWQADYPDPDNFLSVMLSFSDNNHTRWKNVKYDELVQRAAGLIDQTERRKVYREAQKIMLEDDVAAIPLCSSVDSLLISPRVENYPLNVLKKLIYTEVRLK